MPRARSERSWADITDDDSDGDGSQSTSQHSTSQSGSGSIHDYQSSGSTAAQAAEKGKRVFNRPLTREALASMRNEGSNASGTSCTQSQSGNDNDEEECPEDARPQEVSVGSAGHDKGECKPCLFVHTAMGCENGESCIFCHFTHTRRNKPRPCKGKRDRYRKLLNRINDQYGAGDEDASGSVAENETGSESGYSSIPSIPTAAQRQLVTL